MTDSNDQYIAHEMRETLERIARLDREARAVEAEKQRAWQEAENNKDRQLAIDTCNG